MDSNTAPNPPHEDVLAAPANTLDARAFELCG